MKVLTIIAAFFIGLATWAIGPMAIGLMPFLVGFMWSIREGTEGTEC